MSQFRNARICHFCGKAVNPEALGSARQILGWVSAHGKSRAERIQYQEPTGKVAHLACLEAEMRPAQQLQEALFE